MDHVRSEFRFEARDPMKTQSRDLKLLKVRVPRLTSKMVRIGADLPRLRCDKTSFMEVVEPVELLDPVAPQITRQEPERVSEIGSLPKKDDSVALVTAELEPEPPAKDLRDVAVKVIPTPRKRNSRVA